MKSRENGLWSGEDRRVVYWPPAALSTAAADLALLLPSSHREVPALDRRRRRPSSGSGKEAA
jgi:hypothetical protein